MKQWFCYVYVTTHFKNVIQMFWGTSIHLGHSGWISLLRTDCVPWMLTSPHRTCWSLYASDRDTHQNFRAQSGKMWRWFPRPVFRQGAEPKGQWRNIRNRNTFPRKAIKTVLPTSFPLPRIWKESCDNTDLYLNVATDPEGFCCYCGF